MHIPSDLIARLEKLGEHPAKVTESLSRWGHESFLSLLQLYVERGEERVSLFHQWSPRLRAFAAECRTNNQCSEVEALEARDRAKLAIYESKIAKTERLTPRCNFEITICCTPAIGIPVAQQLWPGRELTVILTLEEWRRWCDDIYTHPAEADQWWIQYWWQIEDPPIPLPAPLRNWDLTVPDGESPWMVTSGLSWGSFAGGSMSELWAWNGKEARYVRDICCVKS